MRVHLGVQVQLDLTVTQEVKVNLDHQGLSDQLDPMERPEQLAILVNPEPKVSQVHQDLTVSRESRVSQDWSDLRVLVGPPAQLEVKETLVLWVQLVSQGQ